MEINAGNTAWLLMSTALVMLMLPGLALFYGGLVRAKNVPSTIMHSFFGLAIVPVVWVIIGFSPAFPPSVGDLGIVGPVMSDGEVLVPHRRRVRIEAPRDGSLLVWIPMRPGQGEPVFCFIIGNSWACLVLWAARDQEGIAVSAGYDWYRFDGVRRGVVVRDEVVARKGNAQSYEPAFTEPLSRCTEFEVLDRRGDWVLIRLAGDQEGWIEDDSAVVY